MKLHLTATSERGKPVTKSGNEYLDIEVLGEDRKPILQIHLKPFGGNGLTHAYIRKAGQSQALWAGYIKAEPKTAREDYCKQCACDTPNDGVGNCNFCGSRKTARECEHFWVDKGENTHCEKCGIK